jgi:hypothetical protein
LAALPQFVDVKLATNGTGRYAVEPQSLSLQPGESRSITISTKEPGAATVTLQVSSDLGAWKATAIRALPPPPAPTSTSTSATEGSKDSPGLEFLVVVLAVCLAASQKRQR